MSRQRTVHPRRRGIRAFTITEVMMATMVMAIAISASIITIQRGLYALDTARNTTLASQIIQSEMERIRLLSWGSVSTFSASSDIDLSALFPSGDATTAVIAARFSATRTVTDVADRVGEMKSITVTVTWTGIDGVPHNRTSTTQYCENGLYDYYYTLARS